MAVQNLGNAELVCTPQLAAVMPRFGLPTALPAGWHATAVRLGLDAAALAGALALATEIAGAAGQASATLPLLPLVLGVQFAALALTGAYSAAGRPSAMMFARAAGVAAGLLLLLRLGVSRGPSGSGAAGLSVSVIMLDTLLAFSGAFGLHARRSSQEAPKQPQRAAETGAKLLFVGAGRVGVHALAALRARPDETTLRPVGFVDDDLGKQGALVEGLRVLGTVADLPRLVRELAVDQVVVTLTGASRRELRQLVEQCERVPVKVRVVPDIFELVEGNIETTVRSVDIEGLLGRDPVVLEEERLTAMLTGKRVMITGAGGSIGSELCRQVARFAPESVVLVERCEFALWAIERELKSAYPTLEFLPQMADVGDRARMSEVFSHTRPHVVVHAAAYKHVPLVESNPCEAIKNNIFGTRTTAELAGEFGAETFVLVSTDKAVRPTSMMGATKRVAELVVQRLNGRYATDYLAVRFGNVLGSTGSVVPIFREQIARGGPVTITHPDMVRYFMTIPEAAQLVLQAGAMRAGGEIFVLDMGEPVRIVDLATDMIKQCGLKPEDIEIVFSGIRPGEKMYEELSTDDEVLAKTHHPKILSGKLVPSRPAELERNLDALAQLAARGDEAGARRQLARMLPESQLTLLGGPASQDSISARTSDVTAVSA